MSCFEPGRINYSSQSRRDSRASDPIKKLCVLCASAFKSFWVNPDRNGFSTQPERKGAKSFKGKIIFWTLEPNTLHDFAHNDFAKTLFQALETDRGEYSPLRRTALS
jgi:hypothetical protein